MMGPEISVWLSAQEWLAPDAVLPTQFHAGWHRSRAITAERALMISVLWRAMVDLHEHRFAQRIRDQRLYVDAYEWIASDDQSWPCSFVNICEALGLSPTCVRQELLGEMAPTSAPRHIPMNDDHATGGKE